MLDADYYQEQFNNNSNNNDDEGNNESNDDNSDKSSNQANTKQQAAIAIKLKEALQAVIKYAEKYFDRIDPTDVLELLPKNAPLAMMLKYLSMVFEAKNAKRRNLQVS